MLVLDVEHSESVIHTYIFLHILRSYRLLQTIEYSSLSYTVAVLCGTILTQGRVPDSAALTVPAFALVERGFLERPLVGSTHVEGVS